MSKKTKIINLALQGGGSHAALVWGILDYLLEDGRLDFDSVTATSGGSMNAIVLAQGLMDGGREGARAALMKFWQLISEEGKKFSPVKMTPFEQMFNIKADNSLSYMMFDMMTKIYSPYQFNPTNVNPLRDILEKTIDFEKLRREMPVKLFISASNVRTGKVKIFSDGEISIDSILASACLPFLFQAVQIGDEAYWDGGYMGNPALFPLIYHSTIPDILILHVNPIIRETLPNTASEILNRVNEISFNSSLLRELRAIKFVTSMLDNHWIKDEFLPQIKRIYLHAIRADSTMAHLSVGSKLCVDWPFLMELFERGRAEGKRWVNTCFKDVGKQSSVDIDEYT